MDIEKGLGYRKRIIDSECDTDSDRGRKCFFQVLEFSLQPLEKILIILKSVDRKLRKNPIPKLNSVSG